MSGAAKTRGKTRAKGKSRGGRGSRARSSRRHEAPVELVPEPPPRPVQLLAGTRAGLFLYRSDAARGSWKRWRHLDAGAAYDCVVTDPRDERTVVAAVRPGGARPTLRISRDRGRTWEEPVRPPRLDRPAGWARGRYADRVTTVAPGRRGEPGVWYAGTARQRLFRTTNGGVTWRRLAGLEDLDLRPPGMRRDPKEAASAVVDVVPDPFDRHHLLVAVRPGGVIESFDGGRTWYELNQGIRPDAFLLQNVEFSGDPQRLVACPTRPRRLYLQARSGLYRRELPEESWVHIGAGLPDKVGDIGRALAVHPRDPDRLWVLPLDAGNPMAPAAPRRAPLVYASSDGGKSWRRRTGGLPKEAWWSVRPDALTVDGADPAGVYLGTGTGEVWTAAPPSGGWSRLAGGVPPVRCLATLRLPGARGRRQARRLPKAA